MLKVRDSIIDSSDGADLYNVICKRDVANGDCFNTVAKTFENITGARNVSEDDTGDINIPNMFSAFADPANNDYRIKQSFAETDVNGNEPTEAQGLSLAGDDRRTLRGLSLGYGGGNFEFEIDCAIFDTGNTSNGNIIYMGSGHEEGKIFHLNVRSGRIDVANWGTYFGRQLSELPVPVHNRCVYRFVNNDSGTFVYQNDVIIISREQKLIVGDEPSVDSVVIAGNYSTTAYTYHTDMILYGLKWIENGVVTHEYKIEPDASGDILYDSVGDNHLTYTHPPQDDSQWLNTDAKLVNRGWRAKDIVSWAYYDDSPPTEELIYTMALTGIGSNVSAEQVSLTTAQDIHMKGTSGDSTMFFQGDFSKSFSSALKPFSIDSDSANINLAKSKVVALDSSKASVSFSSSNLSTRWGINLSRSNISPEALSMRLNHNRQTQLKDVNVTTSVNGVSATKELNVVGKGFRAMLDATSQSMTKGYLVSAKGCSVSAQGVSLEMSYIELMFYFMTMKGARAEHRVTDLVTFKEKQVHLGSFKGDFIGGTMYVYKDILSKLETISASMSAHTVEIKVDRQIQVAASNVKARVENQSMLRNRSLYMASSYTIGKAGYMDLLSTATPPLIQTNRMSGYTVSFEASPVSVIYDFKY